MLNKPLATRPALPKWPNGERFSLWDMMRRYPLSPLIEIIRAIEHSAAVLRDSKSKSPDKLLSSITFEFSESGNLMDGFVYYENVLSNIEVLCEALSADHTKGFVVAVGLESGRDGFTARNASDRVSDLMDSLRRETESKFIFVMSTEYRGFYKDSLDEMSAVFERFPRSEYDFVEAGKCLAFGRPTACVLHLMRALEQPLVKMADGLGVPVGEKDPWGTILSGVRIAMRQRDQGGKNVAKWSSKAESQFFHMAADCLKHIQVATRDPGAHAQKERYTSEEARLEYENTKRFLIQMAKDLPSPSVPDPKDA